MHISRIRNKREITINLTDIIKITGKYYKLLYDNVLTIYAKIMNFVKYTNYQLKKRFKNAERCKKKLKEIE